MGQYSYARDWRSDDKYKRDFVRGTNDQQVAIEQFAIELQLTRKHQVVEVIDVPDKRWVKDDSGKWSYNPDYYLVLDGFESPFEVKVARRGFTDEIDFKRSQIDKLETMGGNILYATSREYAVVSAEELLVISEPSRSQKFGGKEVYTVKSEQLDWQMWMHEPEFLDNRRR